MGHGEQTSQGPNEAYLALGANLGDRQENLRLACARLQEGAQVQIVAYSPVFETDAVADDHQPAYLNAVIRVRTGLSPNETLELAMSIERRLGRLREGEKRWAPRTIDIDVLLFNELVYASPNLTLPHPRLLERGFVRVPLAAVATPGLCHPLTHERLDLANPHPGVRPWAGRLEPSTSV